MIWDEKTKPSEFLCDLLNKQKDLSDDERQGLAFMTGKVMVLEEFFEKYQPI